MIKLVLKRRISGKAIKAAERKKELDEEYKLIKMARSKEWNINYKKIRKRMVRRGTPLYNLTHMNPYWAEKLAEEFKKKKRWGKLKKLYKICPEITPQFKAKQEHDRKVAIWQSKLKTNEYLQLQNSRP